MGTLRAGLSFWHPASLLGTWFGTGLLPTAPGTWGSLAALPLAWAVQTFFGPAGLAAGAFALFAAGCWAAAVYIRKRGVEDPPEIVIDEVAGQMLTLAFVPADVLLYAVGFVLFRLADITKPWPAGWANRKLAGGLGVMADDLFAGIYAAAAIFVIFKILRSLEYVS